MSEALPLFILLGFLGLSFAAITGWGLAFAKALGQPETRSAGITDFWLGYLLALVAVEFLNLWMPIDWRTSLFFYVIGVANFIKYQIPRGSQFSTKIRKVAMLPLPVMLLGIASLIFLCLTCLWAMATPINEDSWLYHFQSIRWINEYPIVPGLGNLHGRLAFNQSHFGFLALLNFFPYWNKGYAAGGLLLLVATACTVATVILRDIPFKKLLLTLLLIVIEPMARYSASPSPDFAVSVLQVVGATYLLFLLHANPIDRQQRESDILVAMCVSAALCSVKLSGLIFAVTLSCAALWSSRAASAPRSKVLPRVWVVLTFFALVHLVRGVITSGVPLYPSTLGSFWQFDWSVPTDRIRSEAGWIYSCARTGSPCQDPAHMTQDWSWMNFWWALRIPDNAKILFFASVAATAVTTWVNARGGESVRPTLVRDWLLMVPFFSAMIFWFFSAPDVRFLGRLLELMFACSMWSMICSLDRHGIGTSTVWARWLSLVANLFRSIHFAAFLVCLVLIFSARLFPVPALRWPALPQTASSVVSSESGVRISVPVDGLCWFNKPPCSPSVDPRLEYREPLSRDPLAHGFRLQQDP